MERSQKNEVEDIQAFVNPEEAALGKLERITDHLRREIHVMLRTHGMTWTQYRVLLALQSESPDGLTCSQLSGRLVGTDPDITRLLDRLARQRLVRRRRDIRDRRAVLTEITEEGKQLLESVAPSLDAEVRALFEHMAPARLQLLNELLDEAMQSQKENERESPPVPAARAG